MYTKAIQRLILISIASILVVVLTCVPIGIADSLTDKEIQRQSQFQPKLNTSPEIPHNPNIAKQITIYPGTQTVVFIDDFAWQVFVALNWPADCQKGEPLPNKKIGEAPNVPRVWEFYRTPETVFLSEGKEPPPNPTKPLTCLGSQKLLTAGETVKLTESGKLTGEDKDANPLDFPLVDQRGNYIIVETYINQPEFDQILTNKWYDAVNLERFNNDNQFTLVCSENENENGPKVPCSIYKNEGAIEIKAAWRVFDESESAEEKARYYTTERKLSIPAQSDKCDTGKVVCSVTGEAFSQVVEVGLIGFHIKHKTSEQGWIWSTFEQVDNVLNGTSTGKQYTLYNPNCKENCKPNDHSVVKTPYLWREKAPHAVTRVGGKIENQIPSQIVREAEQSISPEILKQVKKLNKDWQKELRKVSDSSVWQYYKLIGTEWLSNPGIPYDEGNRAISPTPPLANVALEPYIQKDSSCIRCHTSASLPNEAKADFSFLMKKAKSSNSSVTNAQ